MSNLLNGSFTLTLYDKLKGTKPAKNEDLLVEIQCSVQSKNAFIRMSLVFNSINIKF